MNELMQPQDLTVGAPSRVATLEAKIIKADGTVIDLGLISTSDGNQSLEKARKEM